MLGPVADILRRRGTEGWLVGGSVRDRMLGRFSPDLDIVVGDDAAAVAKELAASLRLPWFSLSERYPTYRVVDKDAHVDVAAVRGGSILADLAQRDFTVNAMAVPVAAVSADASFGAGTLLDPFGGVAHLREARLVAVSEGIFIDDPLRLMRAPRFCHTLGLTLDETLADMVRLQAQGLSAAAVERVVNEMCLTLAIGRASVAVRLWAELGLLAVVLPDWETSAGSTAAASVGVALGVATGGSGSGLRAETLTLLDRLDEMIERSDEAFPEIGGFLAARWAEPVDGAVARPVALRLAGLLGSLGVDQVRAIGRRLKLSSSLVSLLTTVARCWRADGLEGLLPEGAELSRAAVAFLWEAAPWEPEVVLLASVGAGGASSLDRRGVARRMMVLAAERARGDLAPCPVDGVVLMRDLGLAGGPGLGRALRAARLAWESGEATSVEALLAAAREALPET